MTIYHKVKAKSIVADKDKLTDIVSKTIHDMATIISATLGPGGRAVLIERDGMAPLATKDGVTVAKSLGVDKAEANIVIEAAKEICLNTAIEAGDGTTTAIVLADALIKYGQAFIRDNPKYNPQRLTDDLQGIYEGIIVPYLKEHAIDVGTEEQLRHVATISANGDLRIANAVVEAVVAAGDDGTVLVEESQGELMKVETIEGYLIVTGLKDLGQIGPAFINDRSNQQVKMENGRVFLYDGSLNDLAIPAAMQDAITDVDGTYDGAPIIVIAHAFSDLVLDKFAKTTKGGITIVPIKTPRSGLPNGASMFLTDMAAYCSATVYDPGNIDSLDEDGIGNFESAKVNMYETFLTAHPPKEDIDARVTELKAICEAAFSEFDRGFIRAAISKLTGGVSTIWVGGASDLEVREKKARVEDVVEAVKSAIAEGVIPGGCVVHLELADLIENHPKAKPSWKIMSEALRYPFEVLMTNCGENPAEVKFLLAQEKFKSDSPWKVFDAKEHKVVDPYEAGIIEPAKVCRVSIGNALSVTSLLITLGGIVCVPRSADLEAQMDMAKQSFESMMAAAKE